MMTTSNEKMNVVKSGLEVLKKMPPIFRYVVIVAISVALSAVTLGLTSCGNISKISIKSDPNNISISVSQNQRDSTAVNVNVNPTLRLYEKQKDEATSGKDY